jgi:hypothetical protein
MTHGDGGVLGEQQLRDGLADQVRASDDDRLRARQLNLMAARAQSTGA